MIFMDKHEEPTLQKPFIIPVLWSQNFQLDQGTSQTSLLSDDTLSDDIACQSAEQAQGYPRLLLFRDRPDYGSSSTVSLPSLNSLIQRVTVAYEGTLSANVLNMTS